MSEKVLHYKFRTKKFRDTCQASELFHVTTAAQHLGDSRTAVFQSLVVAVTLVLSRLDYCNSMLVLVELSANLIWRRVQIPKRCSTAEHELIFEIRRSGHITDALACLDFVSQSASSLKSPCILTYRAVNGRQQCI